MPRTVMVRVTMTAATEAVVVAAAAAAAMER
jgi:hypothetical protein